MGEDEPRILEEYADQRKAEEALLQDRKGRRRMVSDKVAGSPFRGLSSVLLLLRLPWVLIFNPLGLLNMLAARRIVRGKDATVHGASPLALWLPTLIIYLLLALATKVAAIMNVEIPHFVPGGIGVAVTIWTIAISCENVQFGLSAGLLGLLAGAAAVIGVLHGTHLIDATGVLIRFLDAWGPKFDRPFFVLVVLGCLPFIAARLIRSRFENAIKVVGNHYYVARVGGGSSLSSEDYRIRICTSGYEDRLWVGMVDICIIATIYLGKVADAEDAYSTATYVLKDVPEGILVARSLMWATSDDVVTLRRAEKLSEH